MAWPIDTNSAPLLTVGKPYRFLPSSASTLVNSPAEILPKFPNLNPSQIPGLILPKFLAENLV